ncbi:MAG: hypothetical protein R2789_07865 [Microthrixaceae bacterium]
MPDRVDDPGDGSAPRSAPVVSGSRASRCCLRSTSFFSRKGCDEAARRCFDDGVRLTSSAGRPRSVPWWRTPPPGWMTGISTSSGDRFSEALARGIASHHAGMVPAFREAVEQCFTRGLAKVVFATETLALEIAACRRGRW